MIEVRDLAQLEAAFQRAAGRCDPGERFQQALNTLVRDVSCGMYRDFPDPGAASR